MEAVDTTSFADPPFHVPPDVVISLPMPPTTNNLFLNGRPGQNRPRTPRYNAWIAEAGWQLASQRPRQLGGRVSILIEVSDAESADNWDLGNREKATVDLLVRHKIIPGDQKRFVRRITMEWAPVEGVRITISPCA
jgi:Holliday junction resolvase RusA-like endonuclease